MPLRDINTVMNEHAASLMVREDVVMVAVGELEDGTPCIQVYVKGDPERAAGQIGTRIEGHPVDFIVSDDIRPLN